MRMLVPPLRWGEGQKTRSVLISEVYLKVDRYMDIDREHRARVILSSIGDIYIYDMYVF